MSMAGVSAEYVSGFEQIEVEVDGPILWLRIHRPEAMNAYTAQMGAELVRGFALADGARGDQRHVGTGCQVQRQRGGEEHREQSGIGQQIHLRIVS